MGHIETDREKRVAQILETDTTREQLADALWCAEGCVRRLVERTSLLNDQISKLRTEFDKMDRWHSAELAAETEQNRKLRELVDYVTPIAWYAASERERDHMRELGVEVQP